MAFSIYIVQVVQKITSKRAAVLRQNPVVHTICNFASELLYFFGSISKTKAKPMIYKRILKPSVSFFRPASTERRVASPCNVSPAGTTSPSPTPPATPIRRGEFTRAEYMRRQQLRLMEDLDKVLKQKSSNRGQSSTKKTRSRPRSMTREETKLSLSPAKGAKGKNTIK